MRRIWMNALRGKNEGLRERKKSLIAAAVLFAFSCTAEAQASPQKKDGKPETIEPPQGEIIEELLNEGGELKSLEAISPPSVEAYALLLLAEDEEEKGVEMESWKKGLLEWTVGLAAGFSLGMAGAYIGSRSTKGNRDAAYEMSLVGTSLGAALGSIPSVYFSGRNFFNEKGSFWGTLAGGIAGTLAGAVLSYSTRNFTVPIFVIPIFSSAGAVLGSRYLMTPHNP